MPARTAAAASGWSEAETTAPTNLLVSARSPGSGPTTATPVMPSSSVRCWTTRSAVPSASMDPTGTPGGATTVRSARPHASRMRRTASPLGPVEMPTARARSTAARNASGVETSGRSAPSAPAIRLEPSATATTASVARTSSCGSGRTWPCAARRSMAPEARTTTSTPAPEATCCSTSTPPAASATTSSAPPCAAGSAPSSVTSRARSGAGALDERMRMVMGHHRIRGSNGRRRVMTMVARRIRPCLRWSRS